MPTLIVDGSYGLVLYRFTETDEYVHATQSMVVAKLFVTVKLWYAAIGTYDVRNRWQKYFHNFFSFLSNY